eukprot:scaffold24664_cov135-Isochrysis_galbana.AAC.1
MCISSPPTGPLHFAVTEQYAKDYTMLYPGGIDVPAPVEGQPLVHFEVSFRQANKLSESALSEGTPPVWPWTGARCLASCVPG